MNRQRDQLNQIGVRAVRIIQRNWQRLAFFEEHLREVLEGARDHQTRVLQVEPLRYGAWEIQRFGDHHFAL